MDYFNTKLWNLDKVPFIDETKTEFHIIGGTYICDLYLRPHIFECPFCYSKKITIKSKETININHAMYKAEYSLIKFHKRKYQCNNCLKCFKEDISGLKIKKNDDFFYRNAILLKLKDPHLTYEAVSIMYECSKTYVLDLFDKNVDIRRHRLSKILSIDEVYSRKLTKTKYCCVLFNPENGEFLDVLDSRRKDVLTEYFDKTSIDERNNVRYFTSDLNKTYRDIHDIYFKNSIHAVDSFHVIKNLNDRLDGIRIRIMKEYKDSDDFNYWLLKKYNWMLMTGIENIHKKEYYFRKADMRLDTYSIIDNMLKVDKELHDAYYLKEEYRNFNLYYKYDEAREKLDELIELFLDSNSEEMESFGRLLINWKEEIINSFIKVDSWRLSNGKLERANRAIKLFFENAYGFSNFPRTRNRILYCFNTFETLLNYEKSYTNKRKMKPRGSYKKRQD